METLTPIFVSSMKLVFVHISSTLSSKLRTKKASYGLLEEAYQQHYKLHYSFAMANIFVYVVLKNIAI